MKELLLSAIEYIYSDVKQIYIHVAESLVSNPSYSQIDITTWKLKIYKLPGSDKILAWNETLHSKIQKLINSIWNKEELPQQQEPVIVLFIRMEIELPSNY
jgi:hypothetical protein